jgi:hypothetical protein
MMTDDDDNRCRIWHKQLVNFTGELTFFEYTHKKEKDDTTHINLFMFKFFPDTCMQYKGI